MTPQQAFARLSALCARSEHCQHDVLEKMRQWGVAPEAQPQVLARLVEGRYVDDERFARAFVSDKVRYNKWGRRKVEQALLQRHVGSAIVARVLDEVSDSEYVAILTPLLRQKSRSVRAASIRERSMKLTRFALSRGFTIDIIRQCLEDAADEDDFLD